jgi:hypothetical protein
MPEIGRRVWAIGEGYIPSQSTSSERTTSITGRGFAGAR